MKRVFSPAIALLLLAACGDDNGPTGLPTNNVANGTFAAFVDGQVYSPVVAGVSISQSTISISTAGGGLAFSFTVVGTAVGTYQLGPQQAHLAAFNGPGNPGWLANFQQGSGTVTITSVTGRLMGTFNFVLAPVTSTGAIGNKTITSGTFDLDIP